MRAILKRFQGKIIEDRLLKYIVKSYVADPEIRFEDLNKEEFRDETDFKTSGIDSCRPR